MQDRADDRAAIAAVEQVEGVGCGAQDLLHERFARLHPLQRSQQAAQPGPGNLGTLELDSSRSPGLESGTGRKVREWVPCEGGRIVEDEGSELLAVSDMGCSL